MVADTSGGNPDRARIMIEDPEVAARALLWSSVPDQLTGTGVVAAELVRGLLASAERAVEPLRAEHARELERLTEEATAFGEKTLPGRKEITDRFQTRRAQVAHRCPPGRSGRAWPVPIAIVSPTSHRAAVRSRTSMPRRRPRRWRSSPRRRSALVRNPQESLLLQALLVRLGALAT